MMDGRTFARIIEKELAERGIKKGDFYAGAGVPAGAPTNLSQKLHKLLSFLIFVQFSLQIVTKLNNW